MAAKPPPTDCPPWLVHQAVAAIKEIEHALGRIADALRDPDADARCIADDFGVIRRACKGFEKDVAAVLAARREACRRRADG